MQRYSITQNNYTNTLITKMLHSVEKCTIIILINYIVYISTECNIFSTKYGMDN